MTSNPSPRSLSEQFARGRAVRRRNTRRFRATGDRRRIAVLMGGISRERSISLKSGKAVVDALTEAGREVAPVIVNTAGERALEDLPSDAEVAFIALHGKFGEDGGIQQLLEDRGIPYTGADPAASALAFDKLKTKEALRAAGLRTPDSVVLKAPWTSLQVNQAVESVRGTVVVKPNREGSSIGVFICRTKTEVARAIERSKKYRDDLLIETYIEGRELTVPIFRGLNLPLIETRTEKAFFDFDAKYQDPHTEYKVAPTLAPDTQARIFKQARGAHAAIGCDPFSRVDIRLDPEGRPWILEVNTIPGLTATSLLPKAAAHIGLSFPELCALMVENAAVRSQASLSRPTARLLRRAR